MTPKWQIKCLVAGAMVTLLAGCQTTHNDSFSEWQERPLEISRFNVPTVSNVAVTKLEQNERNNGQVQNDKWELACGQGVVTTAHTFDGWFVPQTEANLADEDEFRATFRDSGIVIQKAYPITSNANGKAVGFYGDATLDDLPNCKVAKFGMRAVRGVKIYDNDQGTIDTVVTAFHCGSTEFNMARFTQNLTVIDDREAYGARVKALSPPSCGTQQTTDWSGKTKMGEYNGTVAMSWGNGFHDNNLNTKISLKDYGGKLTFMISDGDQCDIQFRVTKHSAPEAGTWFANCASGDFANGNFRVDEAGNLIGKGENDAKGPVEFSLSLPRSA